MPAQVAYDLLFCINIQGTGCFIQNDQAGALKQHARQGNSLALTTRKTCALFPERSAVAVGEAHDEFMGTGQLCRLYHLTGLGLRIGNSNIGVYRSLKKKTVLRHKTELTA